MVAFLILSMFAISFEEEMLVQSSQQCQRSANTHPPKRSLTQPEATTNLPAHAPLLCTVDIPICVQHPAHQPCRTQCSARLRVSQSCNQHADHSLRHILHIVGVASLRAGILVSIFRLFDGLRRRVEVWVRNFRGLAHASCEEAKGRGEERRCAEGDEHYVAVLLSEVHLKDLDDALTYP